MTCVQFFIISSFAIWLYVQGEAWYDILTFIDIQHTTMVDFGCWRPAANWITRAPAEMPPLVSRKPWYMWWKSSKDWTCLIVLFRFTELCTVIYFYIYVYTHTHIHRLFTDMQGSLFCRVTISPFQGQPGGHCRSWWAFVVSDRSWQSFCFQNQVNSDTADLWSPPKRLCFQATCGKRDICMGLKTILDPRTFSHSTTSCGVLVHMRE